MTGHVPRARRSCLSVPANQPRMVEKARGLPVDQVMLDLEDAVAPAAKDEARRAAGAALAAGEWGGRTRAVRINDATTPWAHRDVAAVVEAAGPVLDVVVLPKVSDPSHVAWLDLLLGQLERELGLQLGRIGIEAQVEDAAGLVHIDAVAAASARLEALVFGPADFVASLGMRTLHVGEQPAGYDVADAYHYPRMRILVAARAAGLQAVDGPYLAVRDVEGFRRAAGRAAGLGYDGIWVLHPAQVEAANEAFTPTPDELARAQEVLGAYEHATSAAGGQRGAVLHGAEMLDEASRKMALAVLARARS